MLDLITFTLQKTEVDSGKLSEHLGCTARHARRELENLYSRKHEIPWLIIERYTTDYRKKVYKIRLNKNWL